MKRILISVYEIGVSSLLVFLGTSSPGMADGTICLAPSPRFRRICVVVPPKEDKPIAVGALEKPRRHRQAVFGLEITLPLRNCAIVLERVFLMLIPVGGALVSHI